MTTQPTTRNRLREAATIRLPDARLPRDDVDALLDDFAAHERRQGHEEAMREIVERLNRLQPDLRNRVAILDVARAIAATPPEEPNE